MRKYTSTLLLLFLAFCFFFLAESCKKQNNFKQIRLSEEVNRREAIAGTWKQVDLRLGVTAELGGTTILQGTSIYELAPALGPIGTVIMRSKDNTYTFNEDGTYSFEGEIIETFLFEGARKSGEYDLAIHDRAVLQLITRDDKLFPYWINDLIPDFFSLQVWVNVPGVGTAPFDIIMEKQ